MSIPLVDSLAHPTLDGTWLGKPEPAADFKALARDMKENNFSRACAIGMWGMDGYAHEPFISACARFPELIPVAGFKPGSPGEIAGSLDQLRELGFRGIKIHPRFSQLDLSDPGPLATTFEEAAKRDLTVFFCTYQHCALANWQNVDPFHALVTILKQAPSARVILVHGGDVELMRYMQLVRFNDRLLLDLSMTLCKYPGSSLDQDIGFLFRHFDRRICIGTDWPQHDCRETRARFEEFSNGIPEDKLLNAGGRNLIRFLGLDE